MIDVRDLNRNAIRYKENPFYNHPKQKRGKRAAKMFVLHTAWWFVGNTHFSYLRQPESYVPEQKAPIRKICYFGNFDWSNNALWWPFSDGLPHTESWDFYEVISVRTQSLTLTWDSVIPSAYASFARSGPARYLVCSKVFSSAKICCPLKVGRVCFFLPSLSWL